MTRANQKIVYLIPVSQDNIENSTEGTNSNSTEGINANGGPNTIEEEHVEARGGAIDAVLQPQPRRSARNSVSMYAEGLAPQELANISSPGPSQVINIPKTLFVLNFIFPSLFACVRNLTHQRMVLKHTRGFASC